MQGPIGPYEIEGELGSGNMGVVYKVRHRELGARYALKLLRVELCDDIDLARFERELQQLAKVSDIPNVVPVHSAGEHNGRLYYVMDYVEGEDLSKVLKRGALDVRLAARAIRDVAQTVAGMHARGVIHRDIKPHNILLDNEGRARLTDFGLAKTFLDAKNRLTQTGELLGTPMYMAVEQAKGTEVGPPADVYSLGMVLFQLVAGVPALEGRTAMSILLNAADGKHLRLADSSPEAPGFLGDLCARTFSLDPSARPSAGEVADLLDRFLAGEPFEPEPSRSPLLTALIYMALISGLGAVAAVGFSALRLPGSATTAADAAVSTDELDGANKALADPEFPGPEETLMIARWLASAESAQAQAPADPERGAILCRVQLLAGECALRRDDADRAAQLLRTARERIESSKARPLRDVGRGPELIALRAGVAALTGDSSGISLIEQAERAREQAGWEQRPDFFEWRLLLHVAKARFDRALELLDAHSAAEQISASLRLKILIGAGEVQRVRQLAASDRLPKPIRAQAHYALSLDALKGLRGEQVRSELETAIELHPESPSREEVATALQRAEPQFCSWNVTNTDGSEFLAQIKNEIQYHRALLAAQPRHRIPESRQDVMFQAVMGAGKRHSASELMHLLESLLALDPSYMRFYMVYSQLVASNPLLHAGRDPHRLGLVRAGYERSKVLERAAPAADRKLAISGREKIAERYARILAALDQGGELDRIVKETLASKDSTPKGQADVLQHLAEAHFKRGEYRRALQHIDSALESLPNNTRILMLRYRSLKKIDPVAAQSAASVLLELLVEMRAEGDGRRLLWAALWAVQAEEQRGDFARAAELTDRVLQVFPDHVGWRFLKARLLSRLDPPQKAKLLEAIKETLEANARRGSAFDLPALRGLTGEDDIGALRKALLETQIPLEQPNVLPHLRYR